MSETRRIRVEGVMGIGQHVEVEYRDWIVQAIETDPDAVWKFMDWSEAIDGTGWEGHPSSVIAVLESAT